jgi:hypothetical protein
VLEFERTFEKKQYKGQEQNEKHTLLLPDCHTNDLPTGCRRCNYHPHETIDCLANIDRPRVRRVIK